MPDPVTEVVLAEADLDALVSPTSSDVWREMHGHSTEAVAAIAAKLAKEGGGGAGLPDWWTVVSTPGSEEVDFAGEVHITPTATNLYGLLIEPQVGFENNFNAFIRVVDEGGTQIFTLDQGGIDVKAITGTNTHITLLDVLGTTYGSLAPGNINIFDAGVGRVFNTNAAEGVAIGAFVPSSAPQSSQVQMYYDDTTGAPNVKFRGKDDNGDSFDVQLPLAWWTVDSTPGSESVTFNGETIGGTFNYAQRAAYAGNPVSVPDDPGGSPTALTWDSLGAGAALLDLTDPALPEVITAGIYAVTAVAHAAEVLSVGATFLAVLHLDFMGDDAVCEMSCNDQGAGAEIEAMVSLACTYYIPAGGVISLTVALDDGTAARDFNLREAMIQRLL